MSSSPSIFLFRNDLRLNDNPALSASVSSRNPVIPVYIWDQKSYGDWVPGAASRWWLHHSLECLQKELAKKGSRLIIRNGRSLDELSRLVKETKAGSIYWNRVYEPSARKDYELIVRALKSMGVEFNSFNASLLCEPEAISTKSKSPFKVFSHFWDALQAHMDVYKPLPAPLRINPPKHRPSSLKLEELGLLPGLDWDCGFARFWTPGERGALLRLESWSSNNISNYSKGRNNPSEDLTSRFSPHLHFGEISPNQIFYKIQRAQAHSRIPDASAGFEDFLRQIGWREFAYHMLFHFPRTPADPLRLNFYKFEWRKDKASLKTWQKGKTGYPIVDAGMRQLWKTGWMHNRVRMIVGSFLVKDLLISWRMGADWFWDTLVDADLANNTFGWQWVAGCGADAAPYFRIFNPTLQSEKFDPDGNYIRKWVPELSKLPSRWIHDPSKAPDEVLKKASVVIGKTYPAPIVDHGFARSRALSFLMRTKVSKGQV